MTVLGGMPLTGRTNVWILFGTGSPVGDPEADCTRGSVYLQTTGSGMAIWSKTATADDTAWTRVGGGSGGTGDVDGPVSAVDGNLAQFDGATGKVIEDSLIPAADVLLSSGSYVDPAWITSLDASKVSGLGTLATQSGTFSGTSSGINTGDQTLFNQTVEDEGTPLTQRGTLNFVGAGVSVADTGGKTTVTIAGGGGGSSIDDILAIEAML